MRRTLFSGDQGRRRFPRSSWAVLLFGLTGLCSWHWPAAAGGADDPPGAYKAESPEPTSAETLILEYINRCRSNPAEETIRCVQTPGIPHDVDNNMFKEEMGAAKPAPPLVFDLALIKAARWHSYYQILNAQEHMEAEGKEGFTGAGPMDRARLAGFTGMSLGENIFRTAKDLWYCHVAFVIDWGKGPGGMQPERGHRRNILNREFRVAGIGAVLWPKGEDLAVTEEFGGGKRRMLGGVVFNDRNHNRSYDIGEGVGDVPISTGAAQAKSWQSGAYAVELPQKEAKLIVEVQGAKYVRRLPDGEENVKFDVNLADLPLFKQGGKLLAAVKKIPKTPKAARFVALVDLHLATQDGLVEESAMEEITTLVTDVREGLEKDMDAARQAVSEHAPERAVKEVQTLDRKYSRTKAEPWFSEAITCAKINAAYLRMKAMRDGHKPSLSSTLSRVVDDQQRKLAKLTVAEWRKMGADLAAKTAALQ